MAVASADVISANAGRSSGLVAQHRFMAAERPAGCC